MPHCVSNDLKEITELTIECSRYLHPLTLPPPPEGPAAPGPPCPRAQVVHRMSSAPGVTSSLKCKPSTFLDTLPSLPHWDAAERCREQEWGRVCQAGPLWGQKERWVISRRGAPMTRASTQTGSPVLMVPMHLYTAQNSLGHQQMETCGLPDVKVTASSNIL